MRNTGRALARTLMLCCALSLFGASADAQQTTTYVYDALGRLTRATHPNNSVTTYTYDDAGNRTEVTTTANSAGVPTANADLGNYAYPLNAPPWLVGNAIVFVSVLDNDTDSVGNPLSIASGSITLPGGATFTVVQSGNLLIYRSNETTAATESFYYKAYNGHAQSSSAAEVRVYRRPAAVSPYARDDEVHAYPINAPPYVVGSAWVYFDPRVNDYDYGGAALTVTGASSTTSGVSVGVSSAGDAVWYRANPTTDSDDSFTYTISNGTTTRTATVLVHRHPSS